MANNVNVGHRPLLGAYSYAAAVTASDATVLTATSAIYIGVRGTLVVTMATGDEATFEMDDTSVDPLLLPISVIQVKSTGTNASNIVALY